MNFFITGKPGIGKTTLIQKIIVNTNVPWGGFYTQEIRENGIRVGFKIINLNGRVGILAHVDQHGKYKVGKYYVNLYDLEQIAVKSIQQALIDKKPILIDEIGKMELVSTKFKAIVNEALNASQTVFGTITLANLSFVNRIKSRGDVIIAELTLENRVILPNIILDFLKEQGLVNV